MNFTQNRLWQSKNKFKTFFSKVFTSIWSIRMRWSPSVVQSVPLHYRYQCWKCAQHEIVRFGLLIVPQHVHRYLQQKKSWSFFVVVVSRWTTIKNGWLLADTNRIECAEYCQSSLLPFWSMAVYFPDFSMSTGIRAYWNRRRLAA